MTPDSQPPIKRPAPSPLSPGAQFLANSAAEESYALKQMIAQLLDAKANAEQRADAEKKRADEAEAQLAAKRKK